MARPLLKLQQRLLLTIFRLYVFQVKLKGEINLLDTQLSVFYKQRMKFPTSCCVAYSSTQWNVKILTSLTKSHMCYL